MAFMPVSPDDKREFESIIKALVLMLGTEAGGISRVMFQPEEMARTANYNLEMSRFLDPYQYRIEVSLK